MEMQKNMVNYSTTTTTTTLATTASMKHASPNYTDLMLDGKTWCYNVAWAETAEDKV
jgi:hypothetical protein